MVGLAPGVCVGFEVYDLTELFNLNSDVPNNSEYRLRDVATLSASLKQLDAAQQPK